MGKGFNNTTAGLFHLKMPQQYKHQNYDFAYHNIITCPPGSQWWPTLHVKFTLHYCNSEVCSCYCAGLTFCLSKYRFGNMHAWVNSAIYDDPKLTKIIYIKISKYLTMFQLNDSNFKQFFIALKCIVNINVVCLVCFSNKTIKYAYYYGLIFIIIFILLVELVRKNN